MGSLQGTGRSSGGGFVEAARAATNAADPGGIVGQALAQRGLGTGAPWLVMYILNKFGAFHTRGDAEFRPELQPWHGEQLSKEALATKERRKAREERALAAEPAKKK